MKDFEQSIDPMLRTAAALPWQSGEPGVAQGLACDGHRVWRAAQNVMNAAATLAEDGINVEVVDARFCKPLDEQMLARVLRAGHPVLTVEDHSLQNGFGSAVIEHAVTHNLPTAHLTRLGYPDRMIAHASRGQQLAEVGLDAAGIARSVTDAVRAVSPAMAVAVSAAVAANEKTMAV